MYLVVILYRPLAIFRIIKIVKIQSIHLNTTFFRCFFLHSNYKQFGCHIASTMTANVRQSVSLWRFVFVILTTYVDFPRTYILQFETQKPSPILRLNRIRYIYHKLSFSLRWFVNIDNFVSDFAHFSERFYWNSLSFLTDHSGTNSLNNRFKFELA